MMILPMVQPPPPLCAQLEMFVCCVGTLTSQQLSSASNQQSHKAGVQAMKLSSHS